MPAAQPHQGTMRVKLGTTCLKSSARSLSWWAPVHTPSQDFCLCLAIPSLALSTPHPVLWTLVLPGFLGGLMQGDGCGVQGQQQSEGQMGWLGSGGPCSGLRLPLCWSQPDSPTKASLLRALPPSQASTFSSVLRKNSKTLKKTRDFRAHLIQYPPGRAWISWWLLVHTGWSACYLWRPLFCLGDSAGNVRVLSWICNFCPLVLPAGSPWSLFGSLQRDTLAPVTTLSPSWTLQPPSLWPSVLIL